jgi:hypothetical protein
MTTARAVSSAYRDIGFTRPRTDDRAMTPGALEIAQVISLPLERLTDLAIWILAHPRATVEQASRYGIAISSNEPGTGSLRLGGDRG